jgi:hypothetical protein
MHGPPRKFARPEARDVAINQINVESGRSIGLRSSVESPKLRFRLVVMIIVVNWSKSGTLRVGATANTYHPRRQ